jgi:hypothetical protein
MGRVSRPVYKQPTIKVIKRVNIFKYKSPDLITVIKYLEHLVSKIIKYSVQ